MKLSPQRLVRFVLAGSCVIATACTNAPLTNSNQRNGNAAASQSNTPQTNTSAKPSQQPDQKTTGSIVDSVSPIRSSHIFRSMSEAYSNARSYSLEEMEVISMKKFVLFSRFAVLTLALSALTIGPSLLADGGANHQVANTNYGVSG